MHKKIRLRFGLSYSGNLKSKSGPADANLKWAGLLALVIAFVGLAGGAGAQATKIPRIGYLAANSRAATSARTEAFRQGLRELAYVEGKNISIEHRYADGKPDRLPALAAELVRLKVDIIVSGGPSSTRAAREETVTIPIVMAQHPDPVGSGLVASLAQPGGNITGLSTLAPELSGKRLELLKETVPKLSRVAIVGTSTAPGYVQMLKELELAARALKVQLQYLDVLEPKDIETTFRAASKERAEAALTLNSPVFNSHRTRIVELAVKNRLPAMYDRAEFVEAGGLMTYGVNSTTWTDAPQPMWTRS